MSNVRVGIIGAGAITQVAHLPALRKFRQAQVVALCDNDAAKARALAERYGIPDRFDDIEELLRHEALDALAICTPTHLHESHILAALSAGLHVLVEKPLAMNAKSAERIAKAAEKKGKVVMVGMNHRYRPDVQTLRTFVDAGELGPIRSMRGTWHVFRPGRGIAPWRQRKDQAGGGAVLDLGLSLLDLALFLGKGAEPVRVSAALEAAKGERAVESAGSAYVVREDGSTIYLDTNWHHVGEGERFWFGVRGQKGTATLNPLEVWKELHGVAANVSPSVATRENAFSVSYRAEWAHFLAAIAGEVPPPSLADHVLLHRIMDAIYRSAADGRDVTL